MRDPANPVGIDDVKPVDLDISRLPIAETVRPANVDCDQTALDADPLPLTGERVPSAAQPDSRSGGGTSEGEIISIT